MGEPATVAAAPIEALRQGDVSAVAALHACCFDEPWRPELIGRIARAPGGFGLLWRQRGEAQGFVLCRTNGARGEVLSLGVAPPVRKRGIARALMGAAIETAGRQGLRDLYLEVAEDNAAALRLYRALGFAQVGRRPGYYARPEEKTVDALTLRRQIVPAHLARDGASPSSTGSRQAATAARRPCGAIARPRAWTRDAEAPAGGRLP